MNPDRLLRVTTTREFAYEQSAIDAIWESLGPLIPPSILRGDEETDPASRVMTLYEALGDDTLIELFHDLERFNVEFDLELYDPEA